MWDRAGGEIRVPLGTAARAPVSSRPTSVPLAATGCAGSVCLTIDLVVYQELDANAVLYWATILNGTDQPVVYSFADMFAVDLDGQSYPARHYTPPPDIRTVRPLEDKALTIEFGLDARLVREIVWRPSSEAEIRVPVEQ